MSRKKGEERKVFEGYSLLTERRVEVVGQRERPDFVADIDGRRVGVELTRIVKPEVGEMELRRKSQLDGIINDLMNRCETQFPHIDVGLEFNKQIGRVSREETCNEVMVVIENHWADVQKFDSYYKELDLWENLPEPVSRINLKQRHKQELARSYAYDAEELWLIVYNEWGAHKGIYG